MTEPSKPNSSKFSRWLLRDKHWLLILCIVLPLLFLIVLELTRNFYLAQLLSRTEERITIIVILVVGVLVFSNLVFGTIRKLQQSSDDQQRQLIALNEIGLKLASEHQLDDVIEMVLHSACETVGVGFGVLAIVNEDRSTRSFVACENHGSSSRVDVSPMTVGALSAIINDGRSLLINDLGNQPQFNDFFAEHPQVNRLIGVPIINQAKVIGGIYLCNRQDGRKFTNADLSALSLLAAQSAVAVKNARIYERLSRLSVLEERQRIAMDLHDGAIQSLYALGLQLESLTGQSQDAKLGHIHVDGARGRVEQVILNINSVIKDLRNYISHLNQNEKKQASIVAAIHEESIRLRAHGISQIDIDISQELIAEQDYRLYSVERALHECVSNIIRHSEATHVYFAINCQPNACIIQVKDNGIGADLKAVEHHKGLGLDNVRTRLAEVNGTLELEAALGKGYSVSMIIPK